jgi:hypothetical protein
MDFSKSISISNATGGDLNINSIAASSVTASLGPRSGYKVMAVSLGSSNAVGYVDKRAVADGVDVGDAYLSNRQIDVSCAVFGSSLADFHSKIQDLSDIMRPTPRYYDSSYGFKDFKFSQATIDTATYTSGSADLRFIIRPYGLPNIVYNQAASIDNSVSTSSSRGFSATVQLSLMAKEPYRYRQTQRSISVSVATVASSSATTAIPNVGSVPVSPVIELAHRTSSDATYIISSVTFIIDSRTVKLNNLDFSAKDTNNETRWYIDFDAHAVYRGVRSTAGGAYVQTLRQDVLDSQFYQFGLIPPDEDATTTLTTIYGGSNSPTATIKYFEAYY